MFTGEPSFTMMKLLIILRNKGLKRKQIHLLDSDIPLELVGMLFTPLHFGGRKDKIVLIRLRIWVFYDEGTWRQETFVRVALDKTTR